jgi:CelD/BcsL family acetyltransferase involved in cellulose biosynthesis
MTAVQPAAVERVKVEEAARLAPASGSVFASWEWLGPWLDHLGGPEPLLYAVGDFAVFGFVERDGVLRLIGDGLSDECGPLCAPEHREAAARAMAAAARGRRLVARDLPGEGEWAAWLGGEVIHVEPCLSVVAPDFDAWLAAQPPSFRRKARVVERRLEAAGAAIRLSGEATVREDLATLMRLHRARFGARSRVFDGPKGAFLLAAAPGLLRAGRLRLKTLLVEGEPLAAMVFLRHRGVESYYQAGWDARAAALSPGFALLLDTVRECGELSLLRGAEPYKLAWASCDRPLVTVSVRPR